MADRDAAAAGAPGAPDADPLAAALAGLLPPGASVVAAREVRAEYDVPALAELADPSPSMAPRRRAEFRTGRACAAHALAGLGRDPVAVGVGAHREPCWPAGVVGSITHTEGLIAAAVAEARVVPALGIDAEPARMLGERVAGVVADPAERARVAELGVVDTVVFGAKEAVFKAWFPATGHWLDFADVRLELSGDAVSGRFAATPTRRLLDDPERAGWVEWLAGLRGRWRVVEGLVLAAAAVPVSRR